MKTIGLIGGLSWESSVEYYRIINEVVRAKLGGLHSAQCLMYSVDFAEIEALMQRGEWETITGRLIEVAQQLKRGNAEFIIICSNTMHKMAQAIEQAVQIPLLHIVDPTAEAIQAQGFSTVALLATGYTMEQDFYKGRLSEKYGLNVLIPSQSQRDEVHRIIFEELVVGVIKPESRERYQAVIADLAAQGAQAVILGCTEIGLLIKPEHSVLPTFDTTLLHAQAAVEWALDGLI
ncbi:MAG: aspartate/glutamate racemase family protein [Chloroflexi bacterium]|nr:aspartate/glutamate racemase family protein [Chloroflexota bacterium]